MTAAGPLVLVVEDEPQMRKLLRASLTANGYRILESATGQDALAQAAAHNPDVILLDLGLPDIDGLVVTQRVREWSTVPIVVISARGQERDKIDALDSGADDHLTKPFGIGELLARLRVALRHADRAEREPDAVVTVGELRLDLTRRQVFSGDREVHLTPTQYKLFAALMKHAGRVLTHRQLLREVWGPGSADQTQYLRVYMVQLRHKLERDPARPRYLVTEPGVGYRLKLEP